MNRRKASLEMRHLKVAMPDQESAALRSFAADERITEGEALRRAMALLALARRERLRGRCLAVAETHGDGRLEAIGEVTGV